MMHAQATIDDLEALKNRAKEHLTDVAARFDHRKVSGKYDVYSMRNAHTTLTTRLYGAREAMHSIMYEKITEKDKHILVVYRYRTSNECAFGVLTYDPNGAKICLYDLTSDDIVEWLAPDMDQLLRHHDALLDKTNALTA